MDRILTESMDSDENVKVVRYSRIGDSTEDSGSQLGGLPTESENIASLQKSVALLQQENVTLKQEMAEIKARLSSGGEKLEKVHPEDSFLVHLAHGTTLVGLREAITSKHRGIRCLWIILLLGGAFATFQAMYEIGIEFFGYPTVTSVKFEKRSAYSYPPLAFCADNWIDVEKGISDGLSLDALTYSLGYSNGFDTLSVQNQSRARQEFLEYYSKTKFNSLFDYYKYLAVDPLTIESVTQLPNRSSSLYYCNNCLSKNVTKEFVGAGICYVNTPGPAYPHSASSSSLRRMTVILEDRTRNLMAVSPRWVVNICDHFDFVYTQCRSVSIESSFHSLIQIGVSEHSSLNTDKSPCLLEPMEDQSAEKCWAQCKNKQYQKAAGCDVFWLASAKIPRGPHDFCNYFDELPNNKSLSDLNKEADESIMASDKNPRDDSCFEKCAYLCKRTAYTLTLEAKYSLIDEDKLGLGKYASSHPNTSVVLVEVTHSAAYDGGIAVWVEVSTFSMSRFIGNIGGTLGLFVGATVLTLPQIVLFGINYLVERKGHKRM